MTTRTKIEFSIVIAWVTFMLGWGFSCEPGRCLEQMQYWLPIWWATAGVVFIYLIWRMND